VLGKLRDKLTTRRALVVIFAVLLALAWAVPSIGASTAKLARLALGRANTAVHDSNLAIDTSNTAKGTANSANATANSANSTANSAKTTANAAQSTANQALSIANGSAHVVDHFTSSFDPGNIGQQSCEPFSVARPIVLASDEVIVTSPETQALGIIVQAYTSASQVTLVFCNVTGGTINPDPGTYEFSVLR
jgi:hypothetical protein